MAMGKNDKKDESIDKKIGRFKRDVAKSGKLSDLRKHEYAVGKSKKKQLKSIEARKKARKAKKGGS